MRRTRARSASAPTSSRSRRGARGLVRRGVDGRASRRQLLVAAQHRSPCARARAELDCWFPLLALSSEQHGGVVSGRRLSRACTARRSRASPLGRVRSGTRSARARRCRRGHRGRKARRRDGNAARGGRSASARRARAPRAARRRTRAPPRARGGAAAASASSRRRCRRGGGGRRDDRDGGRDRTVADEELAPSFDLQASHGGERGFGRRRRRRANGRTNGARADHRCRDRARARAFEARARGRSGAAHERRASAPPRVMLAAQWHAGDGSPGRSGRGRSARAARAGGGGARRVDDGRVRSRRGGLAVVPRPSSRRRSRRRRRPELLGVGGRRVRAARARARGRLGQPLRSTSR